MRPLLLCFLLTACSTVPPLDEYTLARTALEAARERDAARYAPSYWHRAEESYRKGEQHFREEEYEDADEQFRESRSFAEKAENMARLQKYKSGEVVP
jgi:hypothetical protein